MAKVEQNDPLQSRRPPVSVILAAQDTVTCDGESVQLTAESFDIGAVVSNGFGSWRLCFGRHQMMDEGDIWVSLLYCRPVDPGAEGGVVIPSYLLNPRRFRCVGLFPS